MTGIRSSTPTRRTVLSAIGTGSAASLIGSNVVGEKQTESEYVLVQGDRCVPIRPIRGEEPVKAFYNYQLPDRYISDVNGAVAGDIAQYASAGTTDLQRAQTSIAFLYQGPERLSLVVVHGSVDGADGGSVTLFLSGLPTEGEWLVKDDLYSDPNADELTSTNYDIWNVDETSHRIDWTWGDAGTDGGAFGGLGNAFEVVVDPAFNEMATLYDEHYEGTITDWEFLSGADGQERVSLDMNETIRLATGSCEGDIPSEADNQQTEQQDRESRAERETTESEQDDDRDQENGEEDREGSEKYTVCHRPPGNPENARTIQVGSEKALEEHLGHGDSRGPCSGNE